jgi:lipopolysaccharide export system protein LptA
MKKAALIPPSALHTVAAAPQPDIPEELPLAVEPEETPEQKPTAVEPAMPAQKKPAPPVEEQPSPFEEEIDEATRDESPVAPEPEKKAKLQSVPAEKKPGEPSLKKDTSQEKKGGPSFGGSNLPVNIHSDSLEYDNKQNRVAFNGHVVARQGDMVIFADAMRVTYESKGKLKQIEAQGGVKIIQGDRIATGDTIVFYNDQQKIVLTGNPRVWQGDNVINGEKITVFIKEERSIVEGSTGNRVSATIVPKKKEQKSGQSKQSR